MAKAKAARPAPMTVTPCQKCPLRRGKWYRDFTPEELQFIASFKSGELKVRAGRNILSENENSPNLYTVLSGWVLKYKAVEDGRRQVTNYGLPGDLIGLQASVFDAMHHSVEALTDVTLCILPRDKLWTLYENFAGLAFDMTWLGAREESILGEYLLSVGQRRASERLAFILHDLFSRARRAGLTEKNRLMLPVTQHQLADTVGFSLVHTNKALQRLRQTGCFEWTGTRFEMLDEKKLATLASYEPPPDKVRPFL
jgi:CRP/FNR family transcriptional regulator, anaerobic regulatory protein